MFEHNKEWIKSHSWFVRGDYVGRIELVFGKLYVIWMEA